jgi:hypothetical protein
MSSKERPRFESLEAFFVKEGHYAKAFFHQ